MDEEVGDIDYNQTYYLVAGSDKADTFASNIGRIFAYDGSQDQEERPKTRKRLTRDGFQGRNSLVIKEITAHRVEWFFKEITP